MKVAMMREISGVLRARNLLTGAFRCVELEYAETSKKTRCAVTKTDADVEDHLCGNLQVEPPISLFGITANDQTSRLAVFLSFFQFGR